MWIKSQSLILLFCSFCDVVLKSEECELSVDILPRCKLSEGGPRSVTQLIAFLWIMSSDGDLRKIWICVVPQEAH